jgi:hypothetical protein
MRGRSLRKESFHGIGLAVLGGRDFKLKEQGMKTKMTLALHLLSRTTLVIAVVLLFAGTVCAGDKKVSVLEGKVVDRDGKPLTGVEVVATQKDAIKGYEKFEVKTETNGSFVFNGLYPDSEYVVTPEADNFNKKGATVEIKSAPAGEIKKLKDNIVLKFSPFKVSKDGVITDTRTGLEWAPDPGKPMTWEQSVNYAKSLALAGGGWRLPSMAELKELFILDEDYMKEDGYYIDPAFHLQGCCSWSSQLRDASSARFFNYSTESGVGFLGSRGFGQVLAVRSGLNSK